MYLRVTVINSAPSKLEAGIANFNEKVVPAAEKIPGYRGATLIINRETGQAAGSTLWESLEAMNKAEQMGQQARMQAEEATGAEVIDVDRFEITVLERSDEIKLPNYTRVTTAYGPLDRADKVEQLTRGEVLAKLKAQPGFRAFAAGVNRMTGRGFTASSWATPEQREASNAAVASVRDKVIQTGGFYGLEVQLFETVVAQIKQGAAV